MPRPELRSIDKNTFDIVIIGAGINGASSAQHLSAAGYSILLIDKGDFGSGSSSRSTRMMHCGLRYFETPRPILDFMLAPKKLLVALRMAKASMEIRGELAKDSPERMRPIKLMFPIFRDGPYKPWQLDLAFKILSRFGPKDVPLDYERIPAARCGSLPFMDQLRDRDKLHSVAVFTEYMFKWPERVCVDAVLDSERLGAIVRNYTTASLKERNDRGQWTVELLDGFDQQESAHVYAPIVLNMGGIWIDEINRGASAQAQRLIFGTKGAHLVVKLPDEWRDHGIATTNSIGEPHYILPSQGGYHHIGPTETVFEGNIDDITVNADDQEFLLNETRHVFPSLELSDADIVYTWAGVRPLGFDSTHPKGKRSVEIHELSSDGLNGVYAMTAGPIMTHRIAGREMTKTIKSRLPPSRPPDEPNYKPRAFPENMNSPPLLEGDPLVRLSDLAHAATDEHAMTLSDILISRTGVVYSQQLSNDEIHRAAEAVGVHMGWTRETIDEQAADVRSKLQTVYQMN